MNEQFTEISFNNELKHDLSFKIKEVYITSTMQCQILPIRLVNIKIYGRLES